MNLEFRGIKIYHFLTNWDLFFYKSLLKQFLCIFDSHWLKMY